MFNKIIANVKNASKTDIKNGIIIASIFAILMVIKHFVWKALKALMRKIFLNGETLIGFVSASAV